MDFDPKVSENIDRKEDHGRDSAKVARRRKR
jgi:hypothetical protein